MALPFWKSSFQPFNFIQTLKGQRLPAFSQWLQLFRVLSQKERKTFFLLLILFIGSTAFLTNTAYSALTYEVPAQGGHLTEGIVGSPRFLNPVYADINDADRDIVELVFSGLLRYNNAGELVPDLAKDYRIEGNGRIIEVTLQDNIQWHDGFPLTTQDIIFTVETIQDPAYKSPVRANWVGVELEKVSDRTLRFILPEPYAPFLERLTLKILPAHIWKDITPENFPLSFLNLQPIGTGPYKVVDIKQGKSGAIQEVRLERNRTFYATPPYISTITIRLFATQEELVREASRGTLDTFQLSSATTLPHGFSLHEFSLPRTFALFFNLNQDTLKESRIRKALALALNKETLITNVFNNTAVPIDSPLRPELFGLLQPNTTTVYNPDQALELFQQEGFTLQNGALVKTTRESETFVSRLQQKSTGTEVRTLQECLAKDPQVYPEGDITGTFGPLTTKAVTAFQEKYAAQVLAPSGLTKGTGVVGPSTREKLNELCGTGASQDTAFRITISTLQQEPLVIVAQEVQRQWQELGIQVEILSFDQGSLEREAIKPRNYEILLFGEILGKIPDPFPFWHSSQRKDPGLNLSAYQNTTADKLLEAARKETDTTKRNAMYEEFQEILLKDIPALFLYDIPVTYAAQKNIQGIAGQLIANPAQRFSGIREWYIETQKSWR